MKLIVPMDLKFCQYNYLLNTKYIYIYIYICDGCHALLEKSMSFKKVVIVSVKGSSNINLFCEFK